MATNKQKGGLRKNQTSCHLNLRCLVSNTEKINNVEGGVVGARQFLVCGYTACRNQAAQQEVRGRQMKLLSVSMAVFTA